MQEQPPTQSGEGAGAGIPGLAPGENTFLKSLQRPRTVLTLLIAWSLLTVLIEAWPENGIFFDVKSGEEIDGVLGGGMLAWQGLPLALLYFLALRNPQHNRSVFWVGLVQQGAAIAANIFQVGTGTLTAESIIIPVAVSATLAALVAVNLFGEDRLVASTTPAPEGQGRPPATHS